MFPGRTKNDFLNNINTKKLEIYVGVRERAPLVDYQKKKHGLKIQEHRGRALFTLFQ